MKLNIDLHRPLNSLRNPGIGGLPGFVPCEVPASYISDMFLAAMGNFCAFNLLCTGDRAMFQGFYLPQTKLEDDAIRLQLVFFGLSLVSLAEQTALSFLYRWV